MYLNQKGNLLVIFCILALILAVSTGTYYLGINKDRFFPSRQPETTYLPAPTPLCHSPIEPQEGWLKKQFSNDSKFVENIDYPKELTDICDNQLISMGCGFPYIRQANGNYTYTETVKEGSNTKSTSLTVTQEDTLDNIHRLSRMLPGESIDKVRFCLLQNKDIIAVYEHWAGGGGSKNTSYLATLAAEGGVIEFGSIPNPGIAYFTCDQPLLLTESALFLECRGGDGPSGSKTIYKIDRKTKEAKNVLQCDFLSDESGKITTSCK